MTDRLPLIADPPAVHADAIATRRLTHMEGNRQGDRPRNAPRPARVSDRPGHRAVRRLHAGREGLYEEFGPARVLEAPISESAMVGAALGAAFSAAAVVEISFGEFLPAAMNQLINQAPNLHYMTGGVARVRRRAHARRRRSCGRAPAGLLVVVRARAGVESGDAAPRRPTRKPDARRVRDDNPVLYFEAMSLSARPPGRSPRGRPGGPDWIRPAGRRQARATLVVWGSTVPLAIQAAGVLASEGVEISDRSAVAAPWDAPAVLGRCAAPVGGRRAETWVAGGFGAEVAATIAGSIGDLLAPIVRVGAEPVQSRAGRCGRARCRRPAADRRRHSSSREARPRLRARGEIEP